MPGRRHVKVKSSRHSRVAEVEVETGDSDIRHNIEADLKAGLSYVLSIPTNPRAERKTATAPEPAQFPKT